MSRKNVFKTIAVTLALIVVLLAPQACQAASQESKPIVVTSTSVLASIVKDLAGDKVRVVYMVSPSMCPAHYDIKPGDVVTLSKASLVLYHGFEPWIKELVKTVNSTGSWRGIVVKVSGNWNTPDSLKKLYIKVAEALENALGLNVTSRLDECLKRIDQVASELKSIAKENGFEGKPVVCMLWQKPFVSYMGFKIVAVYGPPEKLSPKAVSVIEENATKNHAILVIDNMQSGVEFGAKLARDVGAVHVVLINFPDSVPGIHNVTQMMLYNAKLLANAIHSYKYIVEASHLEGEVKSWRTACIGLIIIVVIEAIIIALQAGRRK